MPIKSSRQWFHVRVCTVFLLCAVCALQVAAQAAEPVGGQSNVSTTADATAVEASTEQAGLVQQNAEPELQGQVTETVAPQTPEAVKPPVHPVSMAFTPDQDNPYSKKEYQAYTVVLTNATKTYVEVLQAEAIQAMDEQAVAAEAQQKKERSKKIGGFLLKAASVGTGVLGSTVGLGSAAGFMALHHTSNALGAASTVVNNVPGGGKGIANGYVQRFNSVVLSPGQTFTFKVLMPQKVEPQMKLIVKDHQTNVIQDMMLSATVQ